MLTRTIRHVGVDQHDVRGHSGGERYCFLGGRGGPDEFKSWLTFHEIGECHEHMGVPVHDENSFYLRVTTWEITPWGDFHFNA